MIRKLLVANRGEIACRILRTARKMGIECAAVYSEPDRGALHTQLADVAFPIGPAPAHASYLNGEAIIAAASRWQADAIHPGYGFLSENAAFAQAVEQNGIIFVGPSSAAIAAMGSKARAKELMAAAGVPLLPGYHGPDQTTAGLQKEADSVGFPLLIKAVAGGGGRGLRVVHAPEAFAEALRAVQREALAAFGDERVLLERYLPDARHVEVQIFSDQQQNCVHLFERDCSIQRRHQKLIEEAPAPGLTAEMRVRMTRAAIKAARAIEYCGAGTVEFLYQSDEFFFMEMNTRLQVEHPVTEAVTGLDLVEWQLRIAQGEALPLQQDEIHCTGWAIEARLNAEDPTADFMPGAGLIQALEWPAGDPGVRIDTGFRSGDRIGVHYDSLLAKIIVHASSRLQAVEKLVRVLQQTRVDGICSNRVFLQIIAASSAFRDARLSTRFLQSERAELDRAAEHEMLKAITAKQTSQWGELHAWRNVSHSRSSRDYHLLGLPAPVQQMESAVGTFAQDALHAPLPGKLIALFVAEGDRLKQGKPLLVIEAMKMEHTLRATADCTVAAVHCHIGSTVQPDQLLIEFEV